MATDRDTIVRVGSRKSQLALIQTNKVIKQLETYYSNIKFELVSMTTTGDQILDTPLSKIGEKNLFTKELEHELQAKHVDMIIHSLKDLPSTLPDGMCIGAVCRRDDPYDGVIMRKDLNYKSLDELPDNSVVGTSSARRIAQLKRTYPNLQYRDIRGNLNTRLSKLDNHKEYSAIILAVAGIERMNWTSRLTQRLSNSLYAVAQGAVAVECRKDDTRILTLLSKITDLSTVMSVVTERAYLNTLEGGCSVPIGVKSVISNNSVMLSGGVYTSDGSEAILDSVVAELPSSVEEILAAIQLSEDCETDEKGEPPTKKIRHHSTTDTAHYNPNNDVGVEFSCVYAYVHAGCPYGKVLRLCEITGARLANQMLENGADKILAVTKKACAEEIEKRRLQLLKKHSDYGLKKGDISNSVM